MQAEVLPDPTAPKIATPVYSPRSGIGWRACVATGGHWSELVAPLITPGCQPSVAGEEHRLERGGWSRRCGVTGAEGSPPRTRTGSVALVSLAEARANQDGPRRPEQPGARRGGTVTARTGAAGSAAREAPRGAQRGVDRGPATAGAGDRAAALIRDGGTRGPRSRSGHG